jgi:hypothetical protein
MVDRIPEMMMVVILLNNSVLDDSVAPACPTSINGTGT